MSQTQAIAAPAPAVEEGTDTPKGGGRFLSVLLLLLLLANLGGTGFLVHRLLQPLRVESVAPAPPRTEAEAFGPTVPLDAFVVNLNEQDGNRYLKTVLEIEVPDAKAVEAVTRAKSHLRDAFLRYLSSLTVADTMGDAGKQKIQAELEGRAKGLLGDGSVRRLFFSEFVVQ